MPADAPTPDAEPSLAQRADRLFTQAMDLPEAQRETHVRTQAGADGELRAATLALLAAEVDSRGWLDPTGQQHARAALLADDAVADHQGIRIGPYRLVRRLGYGGAAVVYLGQREGDDFSQQVAVKLLRRMVVTPDEVLRFRLERQILSSLNHPHIARLLDGGTLAGGQPYLITEFIAGQSITAHAEQHALDAKARLALFAQVVAAVHHAHSQRVIHRDIKPSNVLVDAEGRARLLDFGIAKRLEPDTNGPAPALTRADQQPMTPEYAAPEQREGGEISTATDIYQLGVLLHELLTGERPPQAAAGEVPVRAPRLNRDLQAILHRALQADPARRYASAAALGDDMQRHLDGTAILARPESGLEASRRLLRRHPVASTALALSLLMLVGWLASTQHYTRELARQRDEATASAQRAQRAYALLTDVIRHADPLESRSLGGREVTIWESLDRTAARVQAQLPDDPGTRAEVLGTLAALYRAGDRLDPARALLEAALDAQRQASGDTSAATATLLARLGGLERAAGHNEKAREHVARALSLAQTLPPAQMPQAVSVWLTAGFAALNDGDAHTASAHFERAAPLAEAALPPNASARIEAQFGLASARQRAGDAAGAEEPAGRAVELTAAHFGADHGRMAGPLSAWANVQRALGRPQRAVEALQRTLVLLTREYGPQAASVLAARNNLALALEAAGDPARAQQELATVVALRRSLKDGGSVDILDLAGAYQNLGSSLARHGKGAEALTPLARAQEIYDRELPTDSALRAYPRLSAALAHLDLQQPGAAERMAAGAVEILQRSVAADHPAHAAARCLHGEALLRLGRNAQGATLVRGAVAPLRTAGPGVAIYAERCMAAAATLAAP